MIEAIPLDRISTDIQTRATLNEEVIKEYAQAIKNKEKFPPIDVFVDEAEEEKVYYLADGFHRLQATRQAGRDTITAEVHHGGQRDAILHAVSANESHGLRRTNADRRQAVMLLLNDSEWSAWSNREIARQCRVSEIFIRRERSKIKPQEGQRAIEETRKAKRGSTVYPIRTGGIGVSRKKATQRTTDTDQPETRTPPADSTSPAKTDVPDENTSATMSQIDSEAPSTAIPEQPATPPSDTTAPADTASEQPPPESEDATHSHLPPDTPAEPEPEQTAPEPDHEPPPPPITDATHSHLEPTAPHAPSDTDKSSTPEEEPITPAQRLAFAWQEADSDVRKAFVASYRDELRTLLASWDEPVSPNQGEPQQENPPATTLPPQESAPAPRAKPRPPQQRKKTAPPSPPNSRRKKSATA